MLPAKWLQHINKTTKQTEKNNKTKKVYVNKNNALIPVDAVNDHQKTLIQEDMSTESAIQKVRDYTPIGVVCSTSSHTQL